MQGRARGDAHRGTGTSPSAVRTASAPPIPLELRLRREHQPVGEHGGRHAADVVGRHVVAAGQPGGRLGGAEQVDGRARAGAELHARQLARAPHDGDHVARHLVVDPRGVDLRARLAQRLEADHRPHGVEVAGPDPAPLEPQHPQLGVLVRVPDRKPHEEAVELRLRQRVGALVLDRVLRRQHQERVGERLRAPLDRHLALLHRLQQRGLRLRRGAVDLVGQQHVREHRPAAEHELAAAQRDVAGDVRREHVGRELDAPEVEPERARERGREQRLGDARRPFEQHVAAERDRRQRRGGHLLLADHHLADLAGDRLVQVTHRDLLG